MILSELVNEEEIKEGILLVHFCLLVVKLFCGVAFFLVPSSLPKRIRFLRISVDGGTRVDYLSGGLGTEAEIGRSAYYASSSSSLRVAERLHKERLKFIREVAV